MNTYFLRADSEAELRQALSAAGYDFDGQYGLRFTLPDWTPCENHTRGAVRHDVDVVGVIYRDTGTKGAEGMPIREATAGFHANLTAHELHRSLSALQIDAPAQPARLPMATKRSRGDTTLSRAG